MNPPLVPLSIETPRLNLRMFDESDWDALCQMFEDEECVRYTRGQVQPRWETWRILAAYLGHWSLRGYGPYAVVEKSSGKMMGPVGLWYPGDWPEPEIKYSLTRAFWGKRVRQRGGTRGKGNGEKGSRMEKIDQSDRKGK